MAASLQAVVCKLSRCNRIGVTTVTHPSSGESISQRVPPSAPMTRDPHDCMRPPDPTRMGPCGIRSPDEGSVSTLMQRDGRTATSSSPQAHDEDALAATCANSEMFAGMQSSNAEQLLRSSVQVPWACIAVTKASASSSIKRAGNRTRHISAAGRKARALSGAPRKAQGEQRLVDDRRKGKQMEKASVWSKPYLATGLMRAAGAQCGEGFIPASFASSTST